MHTNVLSDIAIIVTKSFLSPVYQDSRTYDIPDTILRNTFIGIEGRVVHNYKAIGQSLK